MNKIILDICPSCRGKKLKKGDDLQWSYTFDGAECAVCGKMDFFPQGWGAIKLLVSGRKDEDCDCGPHQIKHNNGGNYHFSTAVVEEIIWIEDPD